MKKTEPQLTITGVEREVGLSKDVLRVWERRYGFPAPLRDHNDERLYPANQVEKLRLVKRLMDQGHRPGRLLSQSPEALEQLALAPRAGAAAESGPPGHPAMGELLACLRSKDGARLVERLQQLLGAEGLARFVQDIVVPMSARVGEEWARGELQVYEEHLFSEGCTRVLRQAIAALPPGRSPRVLLTTVPDEPHALGLLMVESLLALQGARCIGLGTQTPLGELARAARTYGADVVALSFSTAFPSRRVPALLQELRAALPGAVELWVGGGAVRRLAAVTGVCLLPTLADAVAAVQAWQARR